MEKALWFRFVGNVLKLVGFLGLLSLIFFFAYIVFRGYYEDVKLLSATDKDSCLMQSQNILFSSATKECYDLWEKELCEYDIATKHYKNLYARCMKYVVVK